MARQHFPGRGQTALWAAAVRRAALDAPDRGPFKGVRPIDRVARRLVEMAIEGDVPAIRELADRLDGRARPAAPDADGGAVQVVTYCWGDPVDGPGVLASQPKSQDRRRDG